MCFKLDLDLFVFVQPRCLLMTAVPLLYVLQESPGRTASGSPRPAGRAGQPTVPGGSQMAAVKKPDPNMKGGSSEITLFKCHTISLKIRLLQHSCRFLVLHQEPDLSFPLNYYSL